MYKYILGLLVFFTLGEASEVVLVTGASRGIGYAIANLLSSENYIVYGGVRTLPSPEKEYPFFPILLDVTKQESIDTAIETILNKEGHIDVLVNNAGVIAIGSIENTTIEEAKSLFEINFFGPVRLAQAVLPSMRAQKKGRIIQMSSRSGYRPAPLLSHYAASKFALEGISETMAVTLKPWNIHVCLIEPGPVKTDFDFAAVFGARLEAEKDPYLSLFQEKGFLDPTSLPVQEAEDIALVVKEAIESETPFFRYQTSDLLKDQAALRMADTTGLSNLQEWDGSKTKIY